MPFKNNFDLKKAALKSKALKHYPPGIFNQKAEVRDDLLHYLELAEMHEWLKYNPVDVSLLGKINIDSKLIQK